MSLRELLAQSAEGLARALRRDAAAGDRPPGARETEDPALFRPLVYGDPERLHVHPTAVLNNALINLSSGEVTVGEHAFFGHNVSILTGTHDWTTFGAERQVAVPATGRDVVIEEGAWVSSNAIVVAPCRIGAHAVVGVGSMPGMGCRSAVASRAPNSSPAGPPRTSVRDLTQTMSTASPKRVNRLTL